MQRARTVNQPRAVVEPPAPQPSVLTPGVKYCPLCSEMVHPHSQFVECKQEYCSSKDRIHRKCIAIRLQNGAARVPVICQTCKLVSTWHRRAWIDASPWTLIQILFCAFVPNALVKLAGWGPEERGFSRWDFTEPKVLFPHIFSSLVTSGIIIGGWKLLVWSKDWFWWALGKVCCCCGCCRRGRYDDII